VLGTEPRGPNPSPREPHAHTNTAAAEDRVVSDRCGCHRFCGDVPECEDSEFAVCKGLDRPPEPPLVVCYVVHRDEEVGVR
jgi:hypothetical protein